MQLLEAPLPRPLPWLKPGLANSVTLAVIIIYGFRKTLLVILVRQVCAHLLMGTLLGPSFILGMAGSTGAAIAMYLTLRSRTSLYIGLISISAAGAVSSNLCQLAVAAEILGNMYIWYQLPFMLLASVPSGIAVGFLTSGIFSQLFKSNLLPGGSSKILTKNF
jgi:heptaprenyl diphosphate synthase